MNVARYFHTATLLSDGRVLVAGGFFGSNGSTSTAEIYNPATGNWSSAGHMAEARNRHTATLLPDGTVLVASGFFFGSLTGTEIYDPTRSTWSTAGQLIYGRCYHTANLLQDGRVLVAGGLGETSSDVGPAELFDPATGTWSLTGSLRNPRDEHDAVLLSTGEVIVTGGEMNASRNPELRSAEIYSPRTGRWSTGGSLVTPRRLHRTVLLEDGRVLVSGGYRTRFGTIADVDLGTPEPRSAR